MMQSSNKDGDLPFWRTKTLTQLSEQEWESLCDGCAKCCLHKLQDEDTNIIYYTNVICRLLDESTCQCKDYARRLSLIRDCVSLSPDAVEILESMPNSCAYRRLYEARDLPEWHYLISGDKELVHRLNKSIKGKVVQEYSVKDYEDHIVDWPIE